MGVVGLEKFREIGFRCFRNAIPMHTVRLPHIGALLAIRAADYANFLGNHKAGIKADAKLADNIDVVALVIRVLFFELLGP